MACFQNRRMGFMLLNAYAADQPSGFNLSLFPAWFNYFGSITKT
jgi:hypothetical protein